MVTDLDRDTLGDRLETIRGHIEEIETYRARYGSQYIRLDRYHNLLIQSLKATFEFLVVLEAKVNPPDKPSVGRHRSDQKD